MNIIEFQTVRWSMDELKEAKRAATAADLKKALEDIERALAALRELLAGGIDQ